MPSLSRAAYLSRLRRAFLVRVHPDRLYSYHDSELRAQQASAVQAIIQRLQEPDVSAWQTNAGNSIPTPTHKAGFQSVQCLVIPLSQSATAQKARVRLGGSVGDLLCDMANALRQSGAADIPLPTSSNPSNSAKQTASKTNGHNRSYQTPPRLQGRVLQEFLSSIERSTIEHRKLARMEAHAAAASVRNAFGFAAVDATKIGWSSKSVVVLLRRLLALHQEFASQTRPSFYPWKLSYSSSVSEEGAVDEHGGKILLNPAGTNVQWLRGLQAATDASNSRMLQSKLDIEEWRKSLQQRWGISLRKGFTCQSYDYHSFLKRLLVESADLTAPEPPQTSQSSNLPHVENVDVVVEDMSVCMRPEITEAGSIMLGTNMAASVCKAALDRLSSMARDRRSSFKEDRLLSREVARDAQKALGLERITFDERTLSHQDFRMSVGRLMASSNEFQISGHLLGIVSTDRFCYIGDDGTLAIPHNWC